MWANTDFFYLEVRKLSNKKFTLQFDFEGNINPIKQSVADLQKSLKGVKLPDNIGAGLEKTFSRLAAEFDNFEAIVKTGFDDLGNISKAEKSFGKISTLVNQLSIQASSLTGVDPKKLIPQESLDRLKGLEKAWADVKKESEKKTNLDKEIEKQTNEIEEQEKALKKLTDQYDKLAAKNKVLGQQKGSLTSSKNAKEKRRNEVFTQMTALEGQKGGKSSAEYKALSAEYAQLSQAIKGLETDIRNTDKEINSNKVEMAGLTTQINSSTEAYNKMRNQLTNLKNTQITPKGLVELRTEIAKLTGLNISEVPTDLEELQKTINGLTEKELEDIAKSLAEIKTNSDALPGSLAPAKESVQGLGEAGKEVTRTANEIENLKSQVLQFFSITNSVQLFKRAITSALNTVKELDATMTEAAVVTEFDVGDMWEKLPEYSKNAQALGVSINGMYQATTLYYQQGLKSNEAMELGIETMKMAKIAGMESAEATEAMTAALRGFNMELNEASATKVNDVYSQLAAVTAADTEQIATAMEKTASIAASANMEFETTAALLAQIIETTQEAPETAGTAMKTIIARFAEVKSLREQGLTSGEDDEGEVIDVNKIQTALRSVGISMEGFFSGTEGLDSVLLKLAEKWGSLDFETQRYIATMAAGSRQQSRFIAMMSDYGRTTELVGQAQNSAGASQKQFEKTQDSLATSLTRLKNAWDEFLMGLANNEILKAGVDGLTKILETINKITEGLSGGNGLIKAVVSLGGVLATFSAGKSLLGGTAVGGAMSGLVGRITGNKGGESVSNKKDFFSVPEGFDSDETKGVGKAKRAELRANAKERLKQTFKVQKTEKVVEYDKKAMQKRIGQSYNSVTPEQQKGLVELGKQLKNNEISAEDAAEKMKTLGIETDNLSTITQKTSLDFNAMGQAASTAGMAIMGVGAATSLLASAFESWGMEEEAEAMQTLSGILMTVGSILMGIGSFLPVLTGLTAAQAAATWAALWPILLIVAALGALVAVIVLVSKALHESSIEGRMEAAAEATERAKGAAEGAKQAYDELLSAKSGYDELQNQLDTLTKGTLEWKQALADSNAQVLELIDKYPELAQYLQKGEHGELEIAEEGWDKVLEQQQQAVKNSSAAVISSQMTEAKLKKQKARDDFLHQGDSRQLSAHFVDDVLSKYREDPTFFANAMDGTYTEAFEDFAKSLYLTADQLASMTDEIAAYDAALAENETILQAQSEALLSASVSEETAAGEYGSDLISGMAAGFADTQGAREKEIQDKFYDEDSKNQVTRDNEYFQQLMSENNISANEMNGDDAHDLEVLYAKMAGISRDEIADGLKGDTEALAKEISKMQAAKEAGEEADRVYQNLSRLDENTQREYAALMSKDVTKLTKQTIASGTDLEKMYADLGFESLKDMATSFGYETEEEMRNSFNQVRQAANEEFTKIANEASKKNIDIGKTYLDKSSAGQLQSYVDLMTLALTTGGQEALSAGFDEIFSQATADQKDKILAAMETYDFAQEGESEAFLEYLESIGITLNEDNEIIKSFISEMKSVNAVFRDFDLSDILDQAKAGLEEAEQIAGQKELTTEQYEKYVASGAIDNEDEWSWNGKGWVNVTNGMDNLVTALKNNTIATLNSTQEEAETKLEWYDSINADISKAAAPKRIIGSKGVQASILDDGSITITEKEKLQSGKADENLWSKFFNSKDEYDEWLEMRSGGADKLKRTKKILEQFSVTDIDISDSEADPYDEYYNEYEKLTTLARKREKLERERNKLLEEGNGKEAKKDRDEYIKALDKEITLQDTIMSGKKAEIKELLASSAYAIGDSGLKVADDGTISFNQAKVNNFSTERREQFDALLEKIEGLRDEMRDAEDAKYEAEDEKDSMEEEDRSAWIEAANRIKTALLTNSQKEIDELKTINDSINDANSKLLESIQAEIDAQRQSRENDDTEQDIADKQQRLLYLQQDSSGANATEILQLQKEIEEAQEDYTDTLIDQKISELQDQNDEAAEQRERQIEILEEQKKIQEAAFDWDMVQDNINSMFDSKGNINMNSSIVKQLMEAEDYNSMSPAEQEEWKENLKVMFSTIYGKKYATGGLADFTGPAWLDGTKSRPEYVLNADQTQAFFALVDVLGSLKAGNANSSQINGDSSFDIDINVESIGSDYDVERLATKIQEMILNSSRYRGNNAL